MIDNQAVKWTELFKKEFEERIAAKPVVYLPMGLCEPHGHTAVLGLDTIKAEYLCQEAAFKYGGIVAPTQGYQIHESGYHAPWLSRVAGNINPYMTSLPPAPMLYLFLYQLRTFYNAGFKLAMVITGHGGGNEHDYRLAAKLFMKQCDMLVEVYTDPELTNGKYAGDHAGRYEISQLLYIRPELIKQHRIDNWKANEPQSRFAQGEDAGEATAEYGEQIMLDCLDGIKLILDSVDLSNSEQRAIMPYETVENVWQELKSQFDSWVTAKIRDGQQPANDTSVWKPYESYHIPT